MVDKVCSSSFEDFMRKEVDPYIDITSHGSRVLITLAIEDVIV